MLLPSKFLDVGQRPVMFVMSTSIGTNIIGNACVVELPGKER